MAGKATAENPKWWSLIDKPPFDGRGLSGNQPLLPTAWWAAIHPKMKDAPMLAPAAG